MEYYNSTGPQEEYKPNEVIFYQPLNFSVDYNKQEKQVFYPQETEGNGVEGIEALFMPKGDGTGPQGGSRGPRDGRGGGKGGAGGGGAGRKTGGGKGGC